MLSSASRTLFRAAPRITARRTMFSGPPTHRYEPVPLGRVVRITSIFAAGVVLPMWAISINGAGKYGL